MSLDFLQPLLDWIQQHPAWAGAFVFLVAFSESLAVVGLFMPGVVLMFAIGTLVALGSIDFWPTFWLAVAGAVAGDGLSFWLGHHFKDRLRTLWPFSRYPALFEKGEEFFLRHGGKGILFGRFVGPVRPIVPATAGMLGMSGWKFLYVNLLSALAWAPAYLLPGMVFGASLGLAAAVATRLAIMVVLLLALLWLGVWLVHRAYRLLAPRAEQLAERLVTWGRSHPRLGQITAALVDPQQPELKGLSIVATSLLLLALLIFALFRQFSVAPGLARLDSSLYHLLQGLRTPWGDQLMTTVAQFGDSIVHAALVAAVLLWLLLRRRYLAAGHWLAAALFAVAMTGLLQPALQMPRPAALEGYSFPSTPAVYAACIYGFLAVLVARELKPRWRTACYAVAMLIILSIAFSVLYLGAYWFSDVVGGLLLGLAWVLVLGVAYRRHIAPPLRPAPLLLISLSVLLGVGGWHAADTHQEELQRYARQRHIDTMAFDSWRADGWRRLPTYRIDTLGTQGQPLNLQWAGPLEELQRHLLATGWQAPAPLTVGSALHWLKPQARLAELVPLPHVHDGRHASLTLELLPQRLIIKLWPADYQLTPGATPLWLGYVARLELDDLPLVTVPTLARDFNTPMQQFKPFVALLNWRLGYRHALDNDGDLWHGEVLLMWSGRAAAGG